MLETGPCSRAGYAGRPNHIDVGELDVASRCSPATCRTRGLKPARASPHTTILQPFPKGLRQPIGDGRFGFDEGHAPSARRKAITPEIRPLSALVFCSGASRGRSEARAPGASDHRPPPGAAAPESAQSAPALGIVGSIVWTVRPRRGILRLDASSSGVYGVAQLGALALIQTALLRPAVDDSTDSEDRSTAAPVDSDARTARSSRPYRNGPHRGVCSATAIAPNVLLPRYQCEQERPAERWSPNAKGESGKTVRTSETIEARGPPHVTGAKPNFSGPVAAAVKNTRGPTRWRWQPRHRALLVLDRSLPDVTPCRCASRARSASKRPFAPSATARATPGRPARASARRGRRSPSARASPSRIRRSAITSSRSACRSVTATRADRPSASRRAPSSASSLVAVTAARTSATSTSRPAASAISSIRRSALAARRRHCPSLRRRPLWRPRRRRLRRVSCAPAAARSALAPRRRFLGPAIAFGAVFARLSAVDAARGLTPVARPAKTPRTPTRRAPIPVRCARNAATAGKRCSVGTARGSACTCPSFATGIGDDRSSCFPTAGATFDVERFRSSTPSSSNIGAGRITVFSIDTVNTLVGWTSTSVRVKADVARRSTRRTSRRRSSSHPARARERLRCIAW